MEETGPTASTTGGQTQAIEGFANTLAILFSSSGAISAGYSRLRWYFFVVCGPYEKVPSKTKAFTIRTIDDKPLKSTTEDESNAVTIRNIDHKQKVLLKTRIIS